MTLLTAKHRRRGVRAWSTTVAALLALLAVLTPMLLGAQGTQATAVGRTAPQVHTPRLDTVVIGLADALRRGMDEGEEIRLAEAAIDEARLQVSSARSGIFPQLSGRLSYQRTLRTPLNTGSGFSLPDSLMFRPDSLASIEQRLGYLERNTPNAGIGALSSLFSNLPFGQRNTYLATLSLSQTVFDPNVFTGISIAREFERMSQSQATEQRLDVALGIIEAYYDAVLASRLADITTLSAEQLGAQLRQVRLVRAAGNASDLDVLKVEVDLQNMEPQRVAALNQRDIALLNLKRLTNIPIEQPVQVADSLSTSGFRPIAALSVNSLVDGALTRRANIEARERELSIRQSQVRLAKGAYLPRVALTANFGKQALPGNLLPSAGDFRDDWNVGFAVQVPIFAGGQRKADVQLAYVQERRTELQLAQLKESVALDVAQQRGELERASALIRARSQTTSQAERVYSLTNLSYEKGLQTSLQLSDARLQLQRSRANEAQALHDYYVALAKLLRAAGAPVQEFPAQRAIAGGM